MGKTGISVSIAACLLACAAQAQTSVYRWVDKDGKGIRYQTIYSNEFHGMKQYPPPPLVGPPGGGRGARPDAQ